MPDTTQPNINISFKPTGDPFIDLGGLVLESISHRFPEKNIKGILEFAIDLYINKWGQKLHSIFHTTSKILNPSYHGKYSEVTLKYYENVLNNSEKELSIQGYCKTCGKQDRLFLNSRAFFPVSGSGAFVNYHHGHEDGTYLCNECTFKLFFVPLGVILIGGMAGMLQTQSEATKNYWFKNVIQENLDKISRNTSDGILRSKFKNPKNAPKNALFEFAGDIINELHDENKSEYLQLITFTNFGAAPNVEIHVLPNPVFTFLNKVLSHYRSDWFSFIRQNYRISKAKWDHEKQTWLQEDKKQIKELTADDYCDQWNQIYDSLLSNKSILRNLLWMYKNCYRLNLKKFPIEIAIHYAKEVLNMDKEQIKLIGRIADVIFELSQKENNYKKYLVMLESAGKSYQLRGALLKIIKANFANGAKEPLIRMEEYANYLFPDGQYWGEVRDLLLIHLYEKYHDHQINYTEIPETIIEITEPETNDSI